MRHSFACTALFHSDSDTDFFSDFPV